MRLFAWAKQMAWMTYIESTVENKTNPFMDVHTNFVRTISDIELPLFLCHLCIGTDIQMVILNKKRL